MRLIVRGLTRALWALALASLASACAGPAPTSPVTHASLGPFTFDAPAGWKLVAAGNPGHYSTVYGFLVAPPATASETCGPGYLPGLGSCDDTLNTPSRSVVMTFREFVSGACQPLAADIVSADVKSGWAPMTISGLDAAANRPALGEQGSEWTWDIAETSSNECSVAEVRARFGPSSGSLGPAVDAVVASLHVVPPPR